jgi:hypothetical protein
VIGRLSKEHYEHWNKQLDEFKEYVSSDRLDEYVPPAAQLSEWTENNDLIHVHSVTLTESDICISIVGRAEIQAKAIHTIVDGIPLHEFLKVSDAKCVSTSFNVSCHDVNKEKRTGHYYDTCRYAKNTRKTYFLELPDNENFDCRKLKIVNGHYQYVDLIESVRYDERKLEDVHGERGDGFRETFCDIWKVDQYDDEVAQISNAA